MRIFSILCLWVLPLAMLAQPERMPESWALIWEDNFDSLNTDIWLVKDNWDHWGGELQVYTSREENVFIEDGALVLRVNREEYSCPEEFISQWHCVRQYNTGLPYEYTSGYIETKPAYNTQFGYLEARILLPYGRGFWPAFWTFKADGVGATNAAEIDIFEMLGHKPPNRITTNVHLDYCNESYPLYPDCSGIPNNYQENIIANYTYSWHTYAVDWSPTHLRFWYDDYMFRVMPNPGVVDPVRTILNMALTAGYPPDEDTPFPSDMKIDYVRVYSNVTSAEDIVLDPNEITLFPNPAFGQSFLYVLSTNQLVFEQLEIVNQLGQTVVSMDGYGAFQTELPISSLHSGYYHLIAHTHQGQVIKGFIK